MARRTRSDNSSVRGPNSALTEFLKEQGISAESIRQRHLARLEEAAANGGESAAEAAEAAEALEEEVEMRRAARLKQRRRDSYTDSEDEEVAAKRFGETDECAACGVTFTLTVHSRHRDGGYLCTGCAAQAEVVEAKAKRNQLAARKKRQKLAAALLDKQDLLSVPKLQDLCISLISRHIDQVDMLGDIGAVNMAKLLRILSKNRRLDDTTSALFLEPHLRELLFWDCSNVSAAALHRIPAFSPHLERLTLAMCGRLHNENLQYFATNLNQLTHLALDGPFLISSTAWLEFFETIGARLEGLRIGNTHRFSPDSLISLLEHCPRLTHLALARLDGLNSAEVYGLLPHYLTHLVSLEIAFPEKEELITDDVLIALMAGNPLLETLVLDNCTAVTDRFLVEGVRAHGAALRRLSLRYMDQITDEGMVLLFENWTANPGLHNVNLQKCTALTSTALVFLLDHSAKTLVELSLNSVHGIEKLFFEDYLASVSLPLLTRLDAGFVRSVDDQAVAIISAACPKLVLLEVYGCNRVTAKARTRDGLKLIGRQSDSI